MAKNNPQNLFDIKIIHGGNNNKAKSVTQFCEGCGIYDENVLLNFELHAKSKNLVELKVDIYSHDIRSANNNRKHIKSYVKIFENLKWFKDTEDHRDNLYYIFEENISNIDIKCKYGDCTYMSILLSDITFGHMINQIFIDLYIKGMVDWLPTNKLKITDHVLSFDGINKKFYQCGSGYELYNYDCTIAYINLIEK